MPGHEYRNRHGRPARGSACADRSDCADKARAAPTTEVLQVVIALLLFLILIAILFGAGVALHALWWIAIIALVLWVIGFFARPRGGRWYYW